MENNGDQLDQRLYTAFEFLKDLLVLFCGEYQPNFCDIPEIYRDDFMSWVIEIKQQTWDSNCQRAWLIYNREYMGYLIRLKIHDLDK